MSVSTAHSNKKDMITTDVMIDLSHKGIGPEDILTFPQNIHSNQRNGNNLIILLRYNNLGDAGSELVGHYLKSDTRIKCIDLSFNNIGDKGIQSICDSLSTNSSLQVLHLSGNSITSAGFNSLSNALSHNTGLISLHLTGNSGGTTGCQMISQALLSNKFIQKLSLSGNKIGSLGASSFGKCLEINNSLREIALSDNLIGDEGIYLLSQALLLNRHIAVLDLSFNQITHVGIESLCNSLSGYTSMCKLQLDNNKIGDTGAQLLAQILPTMALQDLNVGFNEIDADGIASLLKSLLFRNTLRVLSLSGNVINTDVSLLMASLLKQDSSLLCIFLDRITIGPVGEKNIAVGIATNMHSVLTKLTGFHLGLVLTNLGSPPTLADMSNEKALQYLHKMWAVHIESQQQQQLHMIQTQNQQQMYSHYQHPLYQSEQKITYPSNHSKMYVSHEEQKVSSEPLHRSNFFASLPVALLSEKSLQLGSITQEQSMSKSNQPSYLDGSSYSSQPPTFVPGLQDCAVGMHQFSAESHESTHQEYQPNRITSNISMAAHSSRQIFEDADDGDVDGDVNASVSAVSCLLDKIDFVRNTAISDPISPSSILKLDKASFSKDSRIKSSSSPLAVDPPPLINSKNRSTSFASAKALFGAMKGFDKMFQENSNVLEPEVVLENYNFANPLVDFARNKSVMAQISSIMESPIDAFSSSSVTVSTNSNDVIGNETTVEAISPDSQWPKSLRLQRTSGVLSNIPNEVLQQLKSISQSPFKAAELWELHQYFFSPPSKKAPVIQSDASSGESSDSDNDISEQQNERMVASNVRFQNALYIGFTPFIPQDSSQTTSQTQNVESTASKKDDAASMTFSSNLTSAPRLISPPLSFDKTALLQSSPVNLSPRRSNAEMPSSTPSALSSSSKRKEPPNLYGIMREDVSSFPKLWHSATGDGSTNCGATVNANNTVGKEEIDDDNEIYSAIMSQSSASSGTLRPSKRPGNRSTMARIMYYPRIAKALDALKAEADEKKTLTLLRQLRYLESEAEADSDVDSSTIENILVENLLS